MVVYNLFLLYLNHNNIFPKSNFNAFYIDNAFDEKALLHEEEVTDIILLHENCDKQLGNHKNEEVQNNKLNSTKSFEKVFSWLVTFDKVMHSYIGKRSFHFLEQLLSIYVK